MQTTTVTCRDCGRMFFYARRGGAGRKREICDMCKPKHDRNATRERVRRHRKEIRQQQADRPILVMHIRACNGKTYCGRRYSEREAKTIASMRQAGKLDTVICKTCYKAFMADDGRERS